MGLIMVEEGVFRYAPTENREKHTVVERKMQTSSDGLGTCRETKIQVHGNKIFRSTIQTKTTVWPYFSLGENVPEDLSRIDIDTKIRRNAAEAQIR